MTEKKEQFNRDAAEIEAKMKAALAKPWKEATWKQRLFKGGVAAAQVAVGVGAVFVGSAVVNSGQSGRAYVDPGQSYDPSAAARADYWRYAANQQAQQQVYHPVHFTHLNHYGQEMPGWLPTGQSGSWW
jgi:hypothetical protein